MISEILPHVNSRVRDVAGPVPARLREIETVFQGLARLRQESSGNRVLYFYVTDADERLVGVVPARRLLFAEPSALIGEIMVHPVLSVTETEAFGNALGLLAQQRLLALPVVDEQNHLIGIVDISALTHAICNLERREAAEELFQMAGVSVEATRNKTRAHMGRFSWLWISIGAGLLAAFLIAVFQKVLRGTPAVAFFIPFVVMLAESVALRAVTRSLRDLHVIRRTNVRFSQDLLTELQLGGASAGIVGTLIALLLHNTALALVVACSLLAAGASGALLGYSVPTLLRRWHLNPKIACGPTVLALAGLAALSCYLAFSVAILG